MFRYLFIILLFLYPLGRISASTDYGDGEQEWVMSSSGPQYWWEFQQEGHIAFGKLDYSAALEDYQTARDLLQKTPGYKEQTDWDDLGVWIDLVKSRQKLGKIKPDYIHKVHVVFLQNVDGVINSENKKINGTKVKTSLTKQQIDRALAHVNHLRSTLEALSGGHLSLDISSEVLDVTVTQIEETIFKESNGLERIVRQIVFPSIKTPDGQYFDWIKFMLPLLNSVDTFVWYWNGDGFATTANGGGFAYPLISYQAYAPFRGYMSIPSHWSGSALPHEFFHVTEFITGIPFTHGYMPFNRNRYPGWSGKGEMDYQRWQYQQFIAAKGWDKFDLIQRYPVQINERQLNIIKKLVEKIPQDTRAQSEKYSAQANSQWFNEKFYETAFKNARKGLELNPWNTSALRVAMEYYNQTQDTSKTLEFIQKLNQVDPQWWSYNLQAYLQLWKTKDYSGAENTLYEARDLVKEKEQNAEWNLNLGYARKGQGNFSQAMENFQACVSRTTNQAWKASALWEMGNCSYELDKNYVKTVSYYIQSQQEDPQSWRLRNIAWIYHWQLKDTASAQEYYRHALKLDQTPQEQAECYLNLGRIALANKDFSNSRALLLKSLKLEDRDTARADIFWTLGQSYQDDGEQWDKALDYYSQSAQLVPAGWKSRHLAWIQLWKLQKREAAIKNYLKSLELEQDPNQNAGAWLWIARAYIDLEKYSDALQALDKSTSVTTQEWYAEALFWKGLVLAEKLGRVGEGLPFIKQGIERGYDNDFSRFYLKKFAK